MRVGVARSPASGRATALLLWAMAAASAPAPASAQDALRGKRLYHDIGRLSGAGVSCIDCHGGIPGGLHGIGKAANKPSVIEEALGAIHQMAPLRGRVTAADMADIAAYLARPEVPSPDLRSGTVAADGRFVPAERITFAGPSPVGSVQAATMRLLNAGSVAVRFGEAPRVSGPDAGLFEVTATDCGAERVLASGEACSVTVAFRAQGTAGLRSASLFLEHDWLRGGTALALIGRVAPR